MSRDGGPAFPQTNEQRSLRDYFAAQALIGILAAEAHPRSDGALPVDATGAGFTAAGAYCYADAMIAEREKAKA